VIEKDDKTIMTGPRDYATRLWTVPVEAYYNNKIIHTANSAYTQKSAAELYAFLHACLGYPTVATLIDAIKNNRLSTFPGLTVEGVRRHLPKSIATSMGHLHRY